MNRPTLHPHQALPAALAALLLSAARPAPQVAFPMDLGPLPVQDLDEELEALLQEAREEADRSLRRGRPNDARSELDELLAEEPIDGPTRIYLARVELEASNFELARNELTRAFDDLGELAQTATAAPAGWEGVCVWLELAAELADESALERGLAESERLGWKLGSSARVDTAAGAALLAVGRRNEAEERWRLAAEFDVEAAVRSGALSERWAWREHLGVAGALIALDELSEASSALVGAARASEGRGEPEVLARLAAVYFEADGEVADSRTGSRNPGPLFREALSSNELSEPALLGLFRLHRFNWNRQSRTADSYLKDLFDARPQSIAAHLAASGSSLDLGRLPEASEHLDQVLALAPSHRGARALEATLAWVHHDRERAEEILAELNEVDPADSMPERTVGEHLIELYRFSEARPFLERALERNDRDHQAWHGLARARANTGDVSGAREAFSRARSTGAGRRNVVRENLELVLEHIDEDFVERDYGELTFAWPPAGRELLELYVVPFYRTAGEDLARRYGYTPGRVRIEFFDKHNDFSVRSTGFAGFPALGVCFGPVVTAVSPLSELRGSFSWARTGYHEFTHVVHLGLSNNRCPRWITEGLATWEETQANPAWDRNMRRDLVDARANGLIFPLRDLNAAFRGSRVVFGYYQGGLVCRLLIDEFGFPSMIRVLEAFDRGADLDRAMDEVFGLTPEEIDQRLLQLVDDMLAGLAIEPRWDPGRIRLLALTLDREPPKDPAEEAQWRDQWCTIALSAAQDSRRTDAEEALRLAQWGGVIPTRARMLRGRLANAQGDLADALQEWEIFLAEGGEDFQVRMSMADSAFEAGDMKDARGHLEAAEAAFPGFADPGLSAELALARWHDQSGDLDAAMAARERWLAFNADDYKVRLEVARWHSTSARPDLAVPLFEEANDIDPFQRRLHRDWGLALLDLGRFAEAEREARAAQLVPVDLDADQPGPLEGEELADVLAIAVRARTGLGDAAGAREAFEAMVEADPNHPDRAQLKEALP